MEFRSDHVLVMTVMIALLMAGVVKGIGLGLPLTALSIIGAVADLRLAIALIAIPIVATNIYQAFCGGRVLEMLRRYWVINLCSVVGTVIGAQILFMVDPDILTTTLGVVVIVYVAINATGFAIGFQMLPRLGGPTAWALSGRLPAPGPLVFHRAVSAGATGQGRFLRAIALPF